jgi:effector-binding domain-containing protein
MKRTSLFIFCALTVLIAICFIPFNQRVAVKINSSYFNCYQEVFNTSGWENWYPDVKNKQSSVTLINSQDVFEFTIPGGSVLVKKHGSSSSTLSIIKTADKKDFNYTLTVVPNTNQLNTVIIISYRANIINYIIPSLQKKTLQETGIYNFKSHMEDTKQFYGFDIEPGFVSEKNFLVKSKTVPANGIYAEAVAMQKELHNFVGLKHFKQVGDLITQFIRKPGDSVQILVGIPLDKKVSAQSGFLYMYMPPSKVIVACYQGKYQHKKEVYLALEKYMSDKFERPKIAPFEVYADRMPVDSNDVVSFKLNYLVF